jgi:hypothetical protein
MPMRRLIYIIVEYSKLYLEYIIGCIDIVTTDIYYRRIYSKLYLEYIIGCVGMAMPMRHLIYILSSNIFKLYLEYIIGCIGMAVPMRHLIYIVVEHIKIIF